MQSKNKTKRAKIFLKSKKLHGYRELSNHHIHRSEYMIWKTNRTDVSRHFAVRFYRFGRLTDPRHILHVRDNSVLAHNSRVRSLWSTEGLWDKTIAMNFDLFNGERWTQSPLSKSTDNYSCWSEWLSSFLTQ